MPHAVLQDRHVQLLVLAVDIVRAHGVPFADSLRGDRLAHPRGAVRGSELRILLVRLLEVRAVPEEHGATRGSVAAAEAEAAVLL